MIYIGSVDNEKLYAIWDGEQIKYILENKEIAVYNPKIMEEKILFMNNTKANEISAQTKDTIESMVNNIDWQEFIEREEEFYSKIRNSLAFELKLDQKNIKSLTELELDQEIKKKDKNEEQEKQEKFKEDMHLNTNDVIIKQELDLNTEVSNVESLRRVLEKAGKMPKIKGKNFDRMGIVESTDVKNVQGETNSTRFYMVAIATDGTVVPLDLHQDAQEGRNPTEVGLQVKVNGEISQEDVLSRYTIGNSGETISIRQNHSTGEIEVGYSHGKTLGGDGIEGNLSLDSMLETKTTTWRSNMDTIRTYGQGYYYQTERYKEALKESKTDSPNMNLKNTGLIKDRDYRDIDGKEETKSEHEQINLENLVDKIIKESEAVDEVFTREEIKEMIKSKVDSGKEVTDAIQEIKDDANMLNRNKNRFE